MQTHNIHAAKTHFSQLVDAAASGETIIIAKAGIPVAKLVPISAPKRRGMLSHVTFDAEASDAMDAEITELFKGKE
ncbi:MULTISPECIES: type II toxin-antitoxin system Phd/YefM family antitoxin [Pseudomonas syringae group]|uniref:Antitoxin n=3 Tax=Pseudomonas syringae group TaxID=136849 RepID=A0AA40TVG0_9PSED|nr:MULTISPECIES: type II toxin-antitoxin system prevent-host-death family antitoxin [Pseudomonas syringae group]KGS15961.1 prevent-host-death protein [Pseudomonas coronafaciens]KOP58420.1 prevent-host-death protein [Pseudomonas coronafaciens pv. porri]KOP61139.1 prevent-host-death protein [Pseudomonas coronafaciens pv. porri]KPW38995.1 Prevent-host-death family protein [Pseudomonas coronafaciens pv. atropurpurea]KPX31428.1 Prevent-host-death family protein [Pseudomonas coronafaciens pv. garcae